MEKDLRSIRNRSLKEIITGTCEVGYTCLSKIYYTRMRILDTLILLTLTHKSINLI